MEQLKLGDDVIEQIKDLNRQKLTKEQGLLIDKLILNEDLKTRYKRFGLCKECKQPDTGEEWCQSCNAKHFQQGFNHWDSGNREIDKLIQKAQSSAKTHLDVIEWVAYDRFERIEFLARGGFGTTYKANWKDGQIVYWDSQKNQWGRHKPNGRFVALKCLHDSQNVTAEFLKELESHIIMNSSLRVVKCFGITRDPTTNNFMMVMPYANFGNLRQSLNKSFDSMDWGFKIISLAAIALGLREIHDKGLIHHDLHCGNILNYGKSDPSIADLGLCIRANQEPTQDDEKQVYGVLPYVAPEVLKGKGFTQACDIYGFGIITHEVVTGLPPYHEEAHDENLAIKICYGLRPKSDYKIPQLILDIIQQCLDADPLKRPKAGQLYSSLSNLMTDYIDENSLFYNQAMEADKINKQLPPLSMSISSSASKPLYSTHPQAIYTSQLLSYKNLPEPKNSLFEAEHSKSLVVDFTKLNVNK